jgi:soluble lytic murein transglycosylase
LFGAAPVDAMASAPQKVHKKKKLRKSKTPACTTGCTPDSSVAGITPGSAEDEALQRQLSVLARAVRNAGPNSVTELAAFQTKNHANVWGMRAALALGFDEYNKNHGQQALAWLTKAKGDPLLADYVSFWSGQTQRLLKNNTAALADFEAIEKNYPNTGVKEQFLEAIAPTAVETGHPDAAIEALNAYSGTGNKPALLLERAHAYQAAHQLSRAAKDYQTLFYKFPLTDEGKAAGPALLQINRAMGQEYPYPGAELQLARAQIFFDAHKWKESRAEFEKVFGMLHDPANPKLQLVQLRVAQARVQLKGSPSLVASLAPADPEVDAERLFVLSQFYRSAKQQDEMFATIEQIAQKYPASKWTEEALMAAANFYWVGLDREKAVTYYQRLLDGFPNGKNAYNAEWRIAWVSYLDRQPYADDRMTIFLRKYPASSNSSDALYWLGRDAERSGNPGHARAFFRVAADRFPETYFGHAAAARLNKLAPGDENAPDFLASIPPPPVLRSFDDPIPDAARNRWERAMALRIIAFDAAAEAELKSAFFATGSPRLLFEAAQAAFSQGHFAVGMSYGRMIVPSFDSRKISDVPMDVWKALYPLPYEAALRREAARNDFDPMLAAGLIRQESTFQADAVSHADAVGLMQVLPKTGKLLAKQLKVRYTKDKLFDPEYNLQLGMLYIAGLLRSNGAPEYALAAFNAGEDRIAAWRAERNYEEIPELVESIPFTETREYVQVVLRNAEVYRMIYGSSAAPAAATSTTVAGRTR